MRIARCQKVTGDAPYATPCATVFPTLIHMFCCFSSKSGYPMTIAQSSLHWCHAHAVGILTFENGAQHVNCIQARLCRQNLRVKWHFTKYWRTRRHCCAAHISMAGKLNTTKLEVAKLPSPKNATRKIDTKRWTVDCGLHHLYVVLEWLAGIWYVT